MAPWFFILCLWVLLEQGKVAGKVLPLEPSELNPAESTRQRPELLLSALWSWQCPKARGHLLTPGDVGHHHSLCLLLAAASRGLWEWGDTSALEQESLKTTVKPEVTREKVWSPCTGTSTGALLMIRRVRKGLTPTCYLVEWNSI